MRAATWSLAAAVIVSIAATARAAPDASVIRDDRLRDLAVTPSLGRGYSPGANTLHSVCFDALPATRASFDFDYAFEALDLDRAATRDRDALAFLRANTRARVVVGTKERRYAHYVVASLVVDSYYSSFDEGAAHLSKAALDLLGSGDALGFFRACGTHYLRSISRRSQLLTLFSYTTTSTQPDKTFERRLEQAVRQLDATATAEDPAAAAELARESRGRELKIVTKAIGLAADQAGDLISFDLPSYRASIKAAFQAAQDDVVGRITAIEIQPWLANPAVLATLDQARADRGHFARWQMIALNAELHAEVMAAIERAERLAQKARLCRRELDRAYLTDGAVRRELEGTELASTERPERLPLATLAELLSDRGLAAIDAATQAYTQGREHDGSITQCMQELARSGLGTIAFRDLPACQVQPAPIPNADVIDAYCLPRPAPTTLVVVSSPEKRAWLEDAIVDFEHDHPDVDVELQVKGSRAAARDLASGALRPTLWIPAASNIFAEVDHAWLTTHPRPLVATGADRPVSLVLSPLVYATWDDRAKVLGAEVAKGTPIWKAVQIATTTGWSAIGGPAEWGRLKLAVADPLVSQSGMRALVLMMTDFFGGLDAIELAPLGDASFQTWLRPLTAGEPAIESTDAAIDDLIRFGPSKYDFAVTYEHLALGRLDEARERWGNLRLVYPTRTVWADHPAALLDGDWVSKRQRAAARTLIAYLRGPRAQIRALQHGFRSSDPTIAFPSDDDDNPFRRAIKHGFQQSLPPVAPTTSPAVARGLEALWLQLSSQ